jgi:hypothetical protein
MHNQGKSRLAATGAIKLLASSAQGIGSCKLSLKRTDCLHLVMNATEFQGIMDV